MLEQNISFDFKAAEAQTKTTAPSSPAGITEVVLPEGHDLDLVLPTLAHLSQQAKDRWFTWFPPFTVTKQLLQSYGFYLPNVRLVYTKNTDQQLWYAWEALAEGNNHTVVAHLGKLSEKRLAQLEQAARVGRCSGLLIRSR